MAGLRCKLTTCDHQGGVGVTEASQDSGLDLWRWGSWDGDSSCWPSSLCQHWLLGRNETDITGKAGGAVGFHLELWEWLAPEEK